ASRSCSTTSTTGARPRSGPWTRSPGRRATGSSTWASADAMYERFAHKIKTREELAALLGPRPRTRTAIMCHGTFDIVHPGHLRHLMYAKDKPDVLMACVTADSHSTKGAYRHDL